jgi:hypothetical protein
MMVNIAGRWEESYLPHLGGLIDIGKFFYSTMDNNCYKKSAEVIVGTGNEYRRTELN